MKTSFYIFIIISLISAFVPLQAFAAQDAFAGNTYPNVCIGTKIALGDMGGSRFPVTKKYKHLKWLGQLFTADDCGETRLNEFYTSETASYELGSTIWLKKKPTQYFRRLLKTVGYTCKEGQEKTCTYWSTDMDAVQTYKLLLLKSYSNKIKQDDCLNCG